MAQLLPLLVALLLGAPCGVAAAAGAAPLPLLTIGPNTTAWPPPNPNLSFPVGPNPPAASSLRRRLQPPAPAALQGLRLGDIRAKLHVTAELAEAGAEATAQIYWRRRDPNPGLKAVVVTDAQHRQVASSVVALQPACGVVKFEHSGAGDYFVYYLPHFQTGGGAVRSPANSRGVVHLPPLQAPAPAAPPPPIPSSHLFRAGAFRVCTSTGSTAPRSPASASSTRASTPPAPPTAAQPSTPPPPPSSSGSRTAPTPSPITTIHPAANPSTASRRWSSSRCRRSWRR